MFFSCFRQLTVKNSHLTSLMSVVIKTNESKKRKNRDNKWWSQQLREQAKLDPILRSHSLNVLFSQLSPGKHFLPEIYWAVTGINVLRGNNHSDAQEKCRRIVKQDFLYAIYIFKA